MQITHVLDSLDPAKGGPPLVATRLAAAQTLIGHDARVVCFDESNARSRIDKMLAALPSSNSFRIDYLTKHETLLGRWQSAGRELASALSGSDIVHFHGVWDRTIRTGMAVIHRQIPYVVAPHGMLDPWCLRQKTWKKQLAITLVFRKLLNGAHFLHALNADEKKLLAPLRLSCPIEVIANGIFLQEFDKLPPPGSFYAEHPELDGRPFILFLSRLHYKKGLDYLADAFQLVSEEVDNACLVVAGPDDGAQAAFLQHVTSCGLRDRVLLTGGLYGRQKLSALVDASIFCLPSRQEGFSIAILESLACGTPVVVSEECHFPEIAGADAGFVVPLDPEKISDKLLLLLKDEPLRSNLGSRARSLVTSRFTWEKIAQDSVDCYHRHLNY